MAANRERGEFDVTVAGKVYTLKLTTNAMCLMESLVGKSFDDVMVDIQRGSLSATRAFFWSVLQDKHQKDFKTIQDVGNWIDSAGGIAKLAKEITALVKLNTEEAPKDPNVPDPAAVGTGGNSMSKPDGSASA